MNKLIIAIAAFAIFTSCTTSYNVQGSSSVSSLDGNKIYLKAIKDNELKNIDSCDVLHGQFSFAGPLDTVRMATLYMDGEGILPIVLEHGEITIKIDNAEQVVGGTPLNDRLNDFLDQHKQLGNRLNELQHQENQMLLEGIDELTIRQHIDAEAAVIMKQEDSLVTNFIIDNFDNVLGPGVFMMITSGFRYPILTPQIEDIMSKATEKFKNDPYVKDYFKTAHENEARMQGLDPDAPIEAETPAEPSSNTTPGLSAGAQSLGVSVADNQTPVNNENQN